MAKTVTVYEGQTLDMNYNKITWDDTDKCYKYNDYTLITKTNGKAIFSVDDGYLMLGFHTSSGNVYGINEICDLSYPWTNTPKLTYKAGLQDPNWNDDNDIVNKKYVDTKQEKLIANGNIEITLDNKIRSFDPSFDNNKFLKDYSLFDSTASFDTSDLVIVSAGFLNKYYQPKTQTLKLEERIRTLENIIAKIFKGV